jgi:hypothetical protein
VTIGADDSVAETLERFRSGPSEVRNHTVLEAVTCFEKTGSVLFPEPPKYQMIYPTGRGLEGLLRVVLVHREEGTLH